MPSASARSLRARARALFLVTSCAVGAVSCGGAAPPPETPGVAKDAPKAAPVDLTPVPVPANLVLLARAPRPGAALDQLAHWVLPGMPSLAPSIADGLARSLTGENLGRMFDLSRGMDFAMTTDLEKEPMGQSLALSVALADEAAAKRAFSSGPYKLVPIGNGAFRIDGLAEARKSESTEDDGDGDDDTPAEKETKGCGLFPAFGDAPLRLVCGEGPDLFTTLGPYLTRTLTRTKAPSDGHFEVRLAPIHSWVDKNRGQLSTFAAGLMAALGGAATPVQELTSSALVELIDLVSDLDTFTFDAKADEAVAEIRTETGFRSQTALITRLGLANADKVDVAPPTFLRLPKDAEIAAYGRGAPDDELLRPRQLVSRALAKALGSTNLTPADAQAVADALAAMISLPAWSYAFGHDLAELEAASQKVQASPEGAAHEAAMARMAGAFLGWHIFSQEDSGASATHLKNAVAAWNRPGVQKALKTASAGTALPTAKLVTLPAKLGLPAGTVAAELTIFEDAPAKKGAKTKGKAIAMFTLHALSVPDGTSRSWGAFGTNRDALVAQLKIALGQSGDDATLAKRAGIEAVRDARASAAGFLSERGVLLFLGAALAMDEDPRALSRAVAAVKQNPKDADVVAPWTAVAHVGPDKGGSMKGQFKVPRKLVEGVASFMLHGMH